MIFKRLNINGSIASKQFPFLVIKHFQHRKVTKIYFPGNTIMISTKSSAVNLRHQCFLKFDKNNLSRKSLKLADVCYRRLFLISKCMSVATELIEDSELRELAAFFNRGKFSFASCKSANKAVAFGEE